jgi:hypothetical protein
MERQSGAVSPRRWSRGKMIAERLDGYTILVSLGSGALGAAIVALVSGGLVYTGAMLSVQDHRALAMAIVLGFIETLLTAMFKAGAFEANEDDGSLLPLYMSNVRSTRRPPPVPIHFRSMETNQLRQLARSRQQR